MSFLERNLGVLTGRFPAFLAEVWEKHLPVEDFEASIARSGLPTALFRGKSLTSAFDPEKEADRTLAALDLQGADYAILVGFGLGYLTRALRKRAPRLPLLIMEPCTGLFARVLELQNLEDILGDGFTNFMFETAPGSVRLFMDLFPGQRAILIPHRPYAELFPEYLRSVDREADRFRRNLQINANTLGRFSRLWIRNLTRNLSALSSCRPVNALKDAFAGAVAVVCAAGPSLSELLSDLKSIRDRVVLVCVDTAQDILRKNGLDADFLVVMDGQYWNARHLDAAVSRSTAVVTELAGPPRALRLNPGATYLARSSTPFSRDFEEFFGGFWGEWGLLKSGGSVATSAWELARHLGCREIFMAGLDLGYPRGATHVKGSLFEERLVWRSERLDPAEKNGLRLLRETQLQLRPSQDGTLVPTDVRMDLYREWFELAMTDHPEVETYNLSANGVKIAGMKPGGRERLRALNGSPPLASRAFSPSSPWPPVSELVIRWGAALEKAQAVIASLEPCLSQTEFADDPSALSQYLERSAAFGLHSLREKAITKAETAFRLFPSDKTLLGLKRTWAELKDWIVLWREELKMHQN